MTLATGLARVGCEDRAVSTAHDDLAHRRILRNLDRVEE